MLRIATRTLSVFLTLLVSISASAQAVLDVPAAYPTIQSAVNAAGPGSVVAVAPGNYAERIDFLGKNIVVRSTGGPWVTTIVGTGLSTPLIQTALTPITARLQGFTVTGVSSNPVVVTPFTGTAFDNGLTGNALNPSGAAEIDDCVFSGNLASPGGVVQLRVLASGRPRVTRTLFIDNNPMPNATNISGAVGTTGGSGWVFEDCQFISNGDCGIFGFGAAVGATTIDLRRCDFIDNGPFGAVFLAGNNFPTFAQNVATIEDCRFIGNFGNSAASGAISVSGVSQYVVARRSTFRANSTPSVGGAIRLILLGGSQFQDCVFDSNSAVGNGGAVTLSLLGTGSASSPTFAQSTFYGNTSAASGGAIHCGLFGGTTPIVVVGNSILRGNSLPQIQETGSLFYVLFSDFEGGWTGAGDFNFDADPLWRDAANGDFRTLPGSPVIDAGHPAGLWDEDGTLPDVGAFMNQTFGPAGDSLVPVAGSTGFASLRVAGSIGGAMQERRVPLGGAVDFEILPTPGSAYATEWLLFGYFGFPTSGQTLPLGFGEIVMPSPISSGDPNAFLIGSSVPGLGLIGGNAAPFVSSAYSIGFPLEMVFQAIVRTDDIDYRSSNAVRLIVQ